MGSDLTVRFRRVEGNDDLPLPHRATLDSAGYDIRSAEPDLELRPGEIRAVSTGLIMELPPGVECQVRPRSGLAARFGITLKVLLQNGGSEPVTIRRGERIAQLVFARFEAPQVVEVDDLSETDRGAGGFGSTGTG